MGKFTFIVPTIGRNTLPYAIQSVKSQTIQDWKAIICGDGIEPYGTYPDDRITVMTAPGRGSASLTRNYAAQFIDTEWAVLLDDDDWVYPDYLEKFDELSKLDDYDIMVSQMNNYGDILPVGEEIILSRIGISFAVTTKCLVENPMPSVGCEDFYYLDAMNKQGKKIGFTHYCGYYVRKYLNDENWQQTLQH